MKKNRKMISLTMVCIMLAVTGCGSAKNAGTEIAVEAPTAEETAAKEDRNGFDAATNQIYTYGGIDFSVPSYFTVTETENNGLKKASLQAEDANHEYIKITVEETEVVISEESFNNSYKGLIDGLFSQVSIAEYSDISDVAVQELQVKYAISQGEGSDGPMDLFIYLIRNTKTDGLLIIYGIYAIDSPYDYYSDIDQMIGQALVTVSEPETEAREAADAGGVTPEFKEMMDSYEAFFDEYVEFMKVYEENPSDLELLMQLASYLEQYADMIEKLDAVDDEEMSDADLAYYLEVNARIQKKLLEVAQ